MEYEISLHYLISIIYHCLHKIDNPYDSCHTNLELFPEHLSIQNRFVADHISSYRHEGAGAKYKI